MKLSTSTFHIGDQKGHDYIIGLIAKAGFDCFDLNLGEAYKDLENPFNQDIYLEYIDYLLNIATKNNIECNQAHAPFPTYVNGWDEYNEKIYQAIIKAIEIAGRMKAKCLVLHPIKAKSASTKIDTPIIPFEDREELFNKNVDFFKTLEPHCTKYNLKIAIENMYEKDNDKLVASMCGLPDEHNRLIDALNSKYFVSCLDLGHAALAGVEPEDAIEQIGGERLQALHVHDNNYIKDDHQLPYLGKINWDSVCRALKQINYRGDFTFEDDRFIKMFPDDLILSAFKFMHDVGRYLISKIEDPS